MGDCLFWLRRQDSNLRPVAVPGRRCVRRSGLAPCRPRPLARVAPPAPGGAPLAPLREPGGRLKACFITKKNTTQLGGVLFWLRRQDSNLRPPGYEPDELPTALLRDMGCNLDCLDSIAQGHGDCQPLFSVLFWQILSQKPGKGRDSPALCTCYMPNSSKLWLNAGRQW